LLKGGRVFPKAGEEVSEVRGREVVPAGIRGMPVNGAIQRFLMEARCLLSVLCLVREERS
jgi:hypothetical protein